MGQGLLMGSLIVILIVVASYEKAQSISKMNE